MGKTSTWPGLLKLSETERSLARALSSAHWWKRDKKEDGIDAFHDNDRYNRMHCQIAKIHEVSNQCPFHFFIDRPKCLLWRGTDILRRFPGPTLATVTATSHLTGTLRTNLRLLCLTLAYMHLIPPFPSVPYSTRPWSTLSHHTLHHPAASYFIILYHCLPVLYCLPYTSRQ